MREIDFGGLSDHRSKVMMPSNTHEPLPAWTQKAQPRRSRSRNWSGKPRSRVAQVSVEPQFGHVRTRDLTKVEDPQRWHCICFAGTSPEHSRASISYSRKSKKAGPSTL